MTDDVDPLHEVSRQGRRLRYELVLDLVDERTGGDMPATISRSDLIGRLHQRGLAADHIDSTLRAAKSNDELIEIPGRDGRPVLARNEITAIRDVIVEEGEADNPRQDLIGALNQRLQTLQES